MFYILIGFSFGFIIPYLARRFSKFMPATLAYALYRICKKNKIVSKEKRLNNHKYLYLRNKYFMRSFGWGIFTSATTFLISITLTSSETPWIVTLIILLFILTEIDKRMFMLPDLLTLPLLIIGFCYASFAGNLLGDNIIENVQNSALGAVFGYIIPVLASLCIIKKHPDAFGGGDIKLLSAIGAWFGFINIPYIILIATFVFALTCFLKKQRQDAFGPAIVISTLITLFILEY